MINKFFVKSTNANFDINEFIELRKEQQIEDWGISYSINFEVFINFTLAYLKEYLNRNLFINALYVNNEMVAICGLEKSVTLPQINCSKGHSYQMVSVFTKSAHRNKGYQKELIKDTLQWARDMGIDEIFLTTNNPIANKMYEAYNFKYLSDKYLLNLSDRQ